MFFPTIAKVPWYARIILYPLVWWTETFGSLPNPHAGSPASAQEAQETPETKA